MSPAFADTSYWIAPLNARDDLHATAVSAAQTCAGGRVVTSEMVLVEFLNSFSDRGPRLRLAASKAVKTLRTNPNVTVIRQTSALFEKALGRFEDRIDKGWSLTDCASFLIMEAEGIEAALTHDHHFVQAGFQALLR